MDSIISENSFSSACGRTYWKKIENCKFFDSYVDMINFKIESETYKKIRRTWSSDNNHIEKIVRRRCWIWCNVGIV